MLLSIGQVIFRRLCTESAPKMVRILNVAEKNDAAKSLAEVMSRGSARKREGYSVFNKIYEFEYNILNKNCTMSMTSVSGHLLETDFIGQYKKWYSCSPVALFDTEVQKFCPEKYKDIKRTLEREVRGCQYLIIWTDCDREGENIGFEVIQVCKAVKPNIPVYRARFSEITPHQIVLQRLSSYLMAEFCQEQAYIMLFTVNTAELQNKHEFLLKRNIWDLVTQTAVMNACRNLIEPDKNVSDAVDIRQELDLRIGAAFTRFQTLRLQKIFPEVLSDQLISYGSCQFPTLGFVVERYKQVQAFVPEPFWKLKVLHTYEETPCEFAWKRYRLFDHLACFVLFEHCVENPVAEVVEIRRKSKSKWRPQPLDTVELEKLASRKLRINAKETMKIAENLYTKGFISYPRTETNIFPKDLDLAGLVQQQTRDPNWGEFADRVLQHGPNPRNGNKTDQAHPPIHPTKYTDHLQGNDARVYEFIVRHFLACCSQDAQGQETVVEIDIADERFTAQGLMITARNYLEVYPYDRWNAKVIPVYNEGDTFQPDEIEMVASETVAPPLLSEADLISLMEKHGIGTDATHAEHIETIKSRMYVGVKPDGRFVPGQLGMGLVEGYDAMGYEMSKPNLRAELEADLKRICEGKKDKNVVLREQVQKYKEVFIEACRQALKIDEALSQYLGEAKPMPEEGIEQLAQVPVKKCSNCGSDMMLKKKKDGKGFYIGCIGYPDCRMAIWLPDFVLDATVADSICSQCQAKYINFKFKRGSVPPMIPTEYCGCIGGCDVMLSEALGISGQNFGASQRTQQQQNTQHSLHDSGYVSSGHSRGNASWSSTQQSNRPNHSQMNGSVTQNQRVNTHNNVSSNNTDRGNNSRVPLMSVPPYNKSSNVNRQWNNDNDSAGDKSVVCNCGNDAITLTVRKEGPNTGRQFYKCSNSTCNFFLWADEAGVGGSDGGNENYTNNRNTSNFGSGYSNQSHRTSSNTDCPSCNCGTAAKCLTVQKEGPNKGRQFYACSKPRGQGCSFFQWSDESENNNSSFSGGGGGGKKRTNSFPNSGPNTKKTARKCGLCGVEGHTKRNCPHKQ